MSEYVDIVYPDECPKCRCGNVLYSDWRDAYLIWISVYCQKCGYFWREVIDLTI